MNTIYFKSFKPFLRIASFITILSFAPLQILSSSVCDKDNITHKQQCGVFNSGNREKFVTGFVFSNIAFALPQGKQFPVKLRPMQALEGNPAVVQKLGTTLKDETTITNSGQKVIKGSGGMLSKVVDSINRIKKLIAGPYSEKSAAEIKELTTAGIVQYSYQDEETVGKVKDLLIFLEKDTESEYAKSDTSTILYIKNCCIIGLINTVKHSTLPQVGQAAANRLEELSTMYFEPKKYGLNEKVKPSAKFDNAFKEIFEAATVPSQNIEATLKIIDKIIIYLYEQDYTNDKVYTEKRISAAEYYVRILKDFIDQEQKSNPALTKSALNVLGKALIYLAKEPHSELAKSAVELSLNFLIAISLGSKEKSSVTDSAYEISKLVSAARLSSTTEDSLGGGYGFPNIARDLVNAAKRGDNDLNEAVQQAIVHFEGDQSVGVTYGADDIIRTIHEMTDNDTDRQLGQKIIARFTVAYVKPNFNQQPQQVSVPVQPLSITDQMRLAEGANDFADDLRGDVLQTPAPDIKAMVDAALAQAEKDVKVAQAASKAVASGKIDIRSADDEPHLFVGSTFVPETSAVLSVPISELLAELAPEALYAKNVITALSGLEQRKEDNAVVIKISNNASGSADKEKIKRLVEFIKQNGWKISGVEFVEILPERITTNSNEIWIVSDKDIETFTNNLYNPGPARVIAIKPLSETNQELIVHKAIFAGLALRNIDQNDVKQGNPKAEAVVSLLNELGPATTVNIDILAGLVDEFKTKDTLRQILIDIVSSLPTPVATAGEDTDQAFEEILRAVGNI